MSAPPDVIEERKVFNGTAYIAVTLAAAATWMLVSNWHLHLSSLLGFGPAAWMLGLAGICAGLALGALLMNRLLPRITAPHGVFAVVQAAVALQAVYGFDLFELLRGLLQDGALASTAAGQWALAWVYILPAPLLLGAAHALFLPIVVRGRGDPASALARHWQCLLLGLLAGAAGQAFLEYRYGAFGVWQAAGGLSAAAGLLCWALRHRFPDIRPAAPLVVTDEPPAPASLWLLPASLGLAFALWSVVLHHMLLLAFGPTERFALTFITAALLALFAGSLGRGRSGSGIVGSMPLALAAVIIALTAYAPEPLLTYLPQLRNNLTTAPLDYLLFALVCGGLTLLLAIPGALLLRPLPAAARQLWIRYQEGSFGVAAASALLGLAFGLWLARFIVLPHLGLQLSLAVALALPLLLALAYAPRRLLMLPLVAAALAAVMLKPPTDPMLLLSAPFTVSPPPPEESRVSYLRHGAAKTTAAVGVPLGLELSEYGLTQEVAAAGLETGGVGTSLQAETVAGMLPLLYQPQAASAAVLGVGTGRMAEMLLLGAGMQQVDVVESDHVAVMQARGLPLSRAAFADERLRMHQRDPRAFMLAQAERSYDAIVIDATTPSLGDHAAMHSQELYQLLASRLAEQGVLIQHLAIDRLGPEVLVALAKAVSAAFPDFHLFQPQDNVLLLVAANDPAAISLLRAGSFARLRAPSGAPQLGIPNIFALESMLLLERSAIAPLLDTYQDVPPSSDFFPAAGWKFDLDLYLGLDSRWLRRVADDFAFVFRQPEFTNVRLHEPRDAQLALNRNSRRLSLAAAAMQVFEPGLDLREAFARVAGVRGMDAEQVEEMFDPDCAAGLSSFLRVSRMADLVNAIEPHLLPSELPRLRAKLQAELPCYEDLQRGDEVAAQLAVFYDAWLAGDAERSAAAGKELLLQAGSIVSDTDASLLIRQMLNEYRLENHEMSLYLGQWMGAQASPAAKFATRTAYAHSLLTAFTEIEQNQAGP